MATTIDTLVTKYVLDDQYSAKAGKVQASTGSLGSSFGGASAMAGALATGVTIAAAATVALGVRASQTAAKYEVLRQGIQAVTGSATRAQEVFDFAQKQAGPSAFFDTANLAEAAKLLETFKLKTEEFLPLANTMASLFGQNAESLNSFVMALGRIKAGSFGEGFQKLREMGVTRPMLEAEGAKFSASGEFQGTTDAALKAIKAAIEKNFGGLDAAMMGTFQAQLATAGDLVEQSFGAIGKGINEALLPSLKGFNEQLNKFVADGTAEKAGDTFGSLLETFQGFGDGLRSMLDWINTWNPTVVLGKGLGGWLSNVLGTDASVSGAMDAQTKENLKSDSAKKYMKSLGKDAFTGEPTPKNTPTSPIVRQNTVFLGEIAKNTRQSVELQRMAFGAGASSMGVSTVELSDISRSRTGGKIGKAVRLLADTIQEEMLRTYQQGEASRRQSFGRA